MTSADIELLEAAGWTVECESPFEIRNQNGSFATQVAADIVLSHVQAESQATMKVAGQSLSQLVTSAIEHIDALDLAFTRAVKAYGNDDEHEGWRTLYDLTFSSEPAEELRTTLQALGLTVKWCDPDGTYRDDVSAYMSGLSSMKEQLSLLFQPV